MILSSKVQTEFYVDQYEKVSSIDFHARERDITVKITKEECELCEADMSLQEVEYVIKSLKLECTPSCDGITNEFYQVY